MGFRLDRMITMYFARKLQRTTPSISIPILMYHSIAEEIERNVHPYYRTSTSPAVFTAHMKHLREEGYKTCSPAKAVNLLRSKMKVEGKVVVITFDDGFQDFYRQAFPVLSRFGFTATMFLPTSFIGESRLSFKRKNCLTWSEVRELNKHGISFGSHTVSHPQLHELSLPAMIEEIVKSKETIEDKISSSAESFAYPYAFPQADVEFQRRLFQLLQSAGYQNGVCTIVGRATTKHEPFFMERLPINSCDDIQLFDAKLKGGYDWVAKLQHLSKRSKPCLQRLRWGRKSTVCNEIPQGHEFN